MNLKSEAFSLGDERLSCSRLVELAATPNPNVLISAAGQARIQKFRNLVDMAVESGRVHYGINTGFGLLSDVVIERSQAKELQENLIRSHACGVGRALENEMVRALLILKAHCLALGHSGVSTDVVVKILDFLRADILPVIPVQGSVGASGDLAPLAHMAVALCGEGDVTFQGQRVPAAQALEQAGIAPLRLKEKEGLSLINGTQFMSVLGAYAVTRAESLALAADVCAALSLDAMRGTVVAFDERIHNVRQQIGQRVVAANMRTLFAEDDAIMSSHEHCSKVQDPYSFRCVPQVHGASRDMIDYAKKCIEAELNSVSDNPLVFEDGSVISGGNFHGQPLAMSMDALGIAVAELGSISERRIEKLTNPAMSGLPAFLTRESGLNSGMMIPHVVAAALVSENKILAHPAVVDSIPTSADKEDHVSMGPISGMKALKIIDNVANTLAIELIAACQGIDLLAPLEPNRVLKSVYTAVRTLSPRIDRDRILSGEIEATAGWIMSGQMAPTLAKTGVKLA